MASSSLSTNIKEGDLLKEKVDQLVNDSYKVIDYKKQKDKSRKCRQLFQNCLETKQLVQALYDNTHNLPEEGELKKKEKYDYKKTQELTRLKMMKTQLVQTMSCLLPGTSEFEFLKLAMQRETMNKEEEDEEDEEEEDLEVETEEDEDEEDEDEENEDEKEEKVEDEDMEEGKIHKLKQVCQERRQPTLEEEEDDEEVEEEETEEDDEDEEDDENEEEEHKGNQKQKYCYISVEDFQGGQDGDLSFAKGTIFTILEKRKDGWWIAEHEGRETGLVPSTYLEKYDPVKEFQQEKKQQKKEVDQDDKRVQKKEDDQDDKRVQKKKRKATTCVLY